MDQKYSGQEQVRVMNAAFIRTHIPMKRAIELMETAFPILSSKSELVPDRIVMSTPDNSLSIFFKPAFLSQFNRMSIKILTQIHQNDNPDIATIKGMVLLIDMLSGRILSICDGTSITALRTGAASGLATSCLANPDASSVAIFGCGAQGRTQLEAVRAVRPIRKIYLFDLSRTQADRLAEEAMIPGDVSCEINPGIKILKTVDVICTATPSRVPFFNLYQIKPGVHINAIGSYRPDMQEIDPGILHVSKIYLDHAPTCMSESGDLTIPLKLGIIREEDIMGELGQMISGSITGREKASDITVFKSVGNAIQDFFIANEAYEKAVFINYPSVINLMD